MLPPRNPSSDDSSATRPRQASAPQVHDRFLPVPEGRAAIGREPGFADGSGTCTRLATITHERHCDRKRGIGLSDSCTASATSTGLPPAQLSARRGDARGRRCRRSLGPHQSLGVRALQESARREGRAVRIVSPSQQNQRQHSERLTLFPKAAREVVPGSFRPLLLLLLLLLVGLRCGRPSSSLGSDVFRPL
jgi:hypothetical protein